MGACALPPVSRRIFLVPMPRTYLDRKNIGLAKLIYRLRQDLDVFRIIGLNAAAAKRLGGQQVSGGFFGYVQGAALESAALTARKIYDWEDPKKPHMLNSISGVMARIDKHRFSPEQAKAVERFCVTFGNTVVEKHPAAYLRKTSTAFRKKHMVSLERLRQFRNQHVAHSEFMIFRKGAKPDKTLPSLEEFEALFNFAVEFYKMVSDGLLNVGPSGFPPYAGTGLVRTLKNLGLPAAQFDFARKR